MTVPVGVPPSPVTVAVSWAVAPVTSVPAQALPVAASSTVLDTVGTPITVSVFDPLLGSSSASPANDAATAPG